MMMVHDPDYPCPTHDAYKRVSLCKLPVLPLPYYWHLNNVVTNDTSFNVTQLECPICYDVCVYPKLQLFQHQPAIVALLILVRSNHLPLSHDCLDTVNHTAAKFDDQLGVWMH